MSANSSAKPTASYKIVGYESSFLSISIAIVGILSALIKANLTDLETFNIMDIGFVMLVFSVFLTSFDILKSYWRFKCNKLTSLTKVFAFLPVVGTSSIIITIGSIVTGFTKIVDVPYIGFHHNMSFVHGKWGAGYFDSTIFLWIYVASAVFQCLASIFKRAANKQINKTILEQEYREDDYQ